MNLAVPEGALVVLIGAPGSGKSTLARRLFEPDEVLSSDDFRKRLTGNPGDQDVTPSAFSVIEAMAEIRLARGLTTVIDSMGTKPVCEWAERMRRRYGMPVIAVVLDLGTKACAAGNLDREAERHVPEPTVLSLAAGVAEHVRDMASICSFDRITWLRTRRGAEGAGLTRMPSRTVPPGGAAPRPVDIIAAVVERPAAAPSAEAALG